jgi:hypothetical protein
VSSQEAMATEEPEQWGGVPDVVTCDGLASLSEGTECLLYVRRPCGDFHVSKPDVTSRETLETIE